MLQIYRQETGLSLLSVLDTQFRFVIHSIFFRMDGISLSMIVEFPVLEHSPIDAINAC